MKLNLHNVKNAPFSLIGTALLLILYTGLWLYISYHHFFVSETGGFTRFLGWVVVIIMPPYIGVFWWILHDGLKEEDVIEYDN